MTYQIIDRKTKEELHHFSNEDVFEFNTLAEANYQKQLWESDPLLNIEIDIILND